MDLSLLADIHSVDLWEHVSASVALLRQTEDRGVPDPDPPTDTPPTQDHCPFGHGSLDCTPPLLQIRSSAKDNGKR